MAPSPSFPEPRSPRVWWIPVFITIFVAAVAILVTAAILANEAQVRRARHEFAALQKRARDAPPRQAVEMYQQYIDTHPERRLVGDAARELDRARGSIDEWDWQQAQVAAAQHGADFAAAREAYESYLRVQPSGSFVDLAKRQIHRLNEQNERRIFETAAREPDPDVRAKRLQEYLDSHPQAIYSDGAHGLLARIPDEQEAKALNELLESLDALRNEGRSDDALRAANQAIDSFRSDSRRAQLRELAGSLRDAVAKQAAKSLDAMPATRPEERDRAIAAARRILARFGDAPATAAARDRLQALLAAESKDHANDLSSLLRGATTPGQVLRTIRDFVVKTGSSPEHPAVHAVLLDAFRAYYRQLILDAPLPMLYQLTLTDGSTVAGEVEQQSLAYKVISQSGRKRFIPVDEVQRIDPLPERVAAEELHGELESQLLTLEKARELLPLAQSTGDESQINAVQACLAASDPANEQAKQHLQQAGWVCELGGWFPKDDIESTFGGSWITGQWCPPERLAWIHERTHTQEPVLMSEAERVAEENVKVANIDIFRISTQVPLECTISLRDRPVITGYSASPECVQAELRYSFDIHVTPAQTISDQEIGALVTKELAALASQAKLGATLKIERKAVREIGFGFTLALRDGRWCIDTVFPDSPAYEAGIEPGHTVTRIGQALLTDQLSEADIAGLTTGAEGTSAHIEFANGKEIYDLDLIRRPVVHWTESDSTIIEHNLNGTKATQKEPLKAI